MGYEGLIIESHCDPDQAWSDAAQQVTPEALGVILDSLVIRDVRQTTESLGMMRREIDRLDNELLEVLNRRMAVCRDVGRYKLEHRMPVVQTSRYKDIISSRMDSGEKMGMSPDFIRNVFTAVHEESVRQQVKIHNESNENPETPAR